MIDRFCLAFSLMKPRMYRQEARKNYLALAKSKKRSKKRIRKTIRKQLGYVKCNLGYLETFMSEGYAPTSTEIVLPETITLLYEQQEYMYQNRVHLVGDRIVSIQQLYLRLIVRGKAKAPAKLVDVS